jgi:hypothetical protein
MTEPLDLKAPAAIATPAEAGAFIQSLRRTMAELSAVLAEETAFVRSAQMRAASPIEARKAELSRRYMADLSVLKANAAFLKRAAGPALAVVRTENETLQRALEVNLAVLATAHAVAEGIIRHVSAAVQAKRAPAGYGATGRATAPPPRASVPVAVVKSL